MVRRTSRSYSAIERGFEDLEKKEAQLRRYYKPFDEQELERLQGDFSQCTSSRHRYADVLQWADDTTALMGIDDPALAERLQRRHARVVSALQRTTARAAGRSGGKHSSAKLVRPNSAPPGFDPVPVGSALQAALMGALESAQAAPAPSHSSKGFESRLLDEYLRSHSLRPSSASSTASSTTPTTGPQQGQVQAQGQGQGAGVGAGPRAGVRPVSALRLTTELTDLPLIDEGVEEEVEEVEEGLDGEEMAPDALLMYYGSRRPRGHSAARTRSISPSTRGGSANAANGLRSTPAGPSRPASATAHHTVHHKQPGMPHHSHFSSVRPRSAATLSTPSEGQRGATAPDRRSPYFLQTYSSSLSACGLGDGPAARNHVPSRPWSASATAQPASSSAHWASSSGRQGSRQAGTIASVAAAPAAASKTQLRSYGSLVLRGSSSSLGSDDLHPHAGHSMTSGAPVKQGTAWNGVICRDPTGPAVATRRAQRPMSARAAAESQRALQKAAAAACARWAEGKTMHATAPAVSGAEAPQEAPALCITGSRPTTAAEGGASRKASAGLGGAVVATEEVDVGRPGEVRSLVALQAARQASIVRLSALHGLQPLA